MKLIRGCVLNLSISNIISRTGNKGWLLSPKTASLFCALFKKLQYFLHADNQIMNIPGYISTTTVCDCGVLESNKILVEQFFYKDCTAIIF